jgi:hypothetical protein
LAKAGGRTNQRCENSIENARENQEQNRNIDTLGARDRNALSEGRNEIGAWALAWAAQGLTFELDIPEETLSLEASE